MARRAGVITFNVEGDHMSNGRSGRGWSSHAALLLPVVVIFSLSSAVRSAPAAQPIRSASAALAAQPGERLFMTRGEQTMTASVGRDEMTGRQIELRRDGNAVRGLIGDQIATLRWQPGQSRVSGALGDRTVELVLSLSGTPISLSIIGWFGARAIELSVSRETLKGSFGACQYYLAFRGDHYAGNVSCGGAPETATLTVPATLAGRPPEEMAALLVAFLAI
jgi:hypothetical protein